MSEERRIPIEQVASSLDVLMVKLLDGDLPEMPFWLVIGNTGYKITEECRRDLARGILLALDVRGNIGI